MKKVMAATLAVLLLFFLCSCGELSAYRLYSNAQKNAEENRDNFETKTLVTLKLKADESGKTAEKTYGLHVKKDGDSISSTVKTDIGMGITVESELVYLDGYVYAKIMGVKAKMPMEIEKFKSDYAYENDVTPLFSEEDLKSVKVEKNEDGLRTLKLTVGTDKINKSIYDGVKQMMNAAVIGYVATLSEESTEIEFSDINVIITFDNGGCFKNFDMTFSVNAVVLSKTLSADVKAEVEYLDFGSTSVDVPDDLDEYKEHRLLPENIFK